MLKAKDTLSSLDQVVMLDDIFSRQFLGCSVCIWEWELELTVPPLDSGVHPSPGKEGVLQIWPQLKCSVLVGEGLKQGVPPGLNVSCCQVGILSCFHDNIFLCWGTRSCTCDLDEKDNERMYII